MQSSQQSIADNFATDATRPQEIPGSVAGGCWQNQLGLYWLCGARPGQAPV